MKYFVGYKQDNITFVFLKKIESGKIEITTDYNKAINVGSKKFGVELCEYLNGISNNTFVTLEVNFEIKEA